MTVEDETIEGVNCRLTWTEGGIEQNTDKLYADIERLIETCLYSNDETATNVKTADKTGSADPMTTEITNPPPEVEELQSTRSKAGA